MKRMYFQQLFRFRLKSIALPKTVLYKSILAGSVALVLILNMVLDIPFHIQNVFASPGHEGGHANEESLSGSSSEFPIVTVEKAKPADQFSQSIEASGEVLPYQESDIFALREGVVQDLYVNVGDVVTKGQVLGYLYADVEQTILNAELKLAQAEQNAAQKRREFLESVPQVQREQIENAIGFAQEGVSLAETTKSKALSQLQTALDITEQEIESTKVQQEAQLSQLDVQIATAQQKLNQQQLSIFNGVTDVISAVENLLYNRSGVITNNTSSNPRFSSSLFTQGQSTLFDLSQSTRNLYKDFLNFESLDENEQNSNVDQLRLFLDNALSVSQDARIISSKMQEIGLTPEEVSEIKRQIDEATDHLVEISDGIINSLGEIQTAEAEKVKLKTELEQELVRLNGEIRKLEQEKDRSTAEQQTSVTEKLSSVKELEKQLDIFSKGVEQQFLEGDLNVAIKNAQVESIRQKIGAGRAIVAPFSGTISRRYVNEGDSVDLGKPVYNMVNDSTKFVRFFVPEADLVFIEKDLEISLSSTSSKSLQTKAKIVRISPALDKDTRTVLIEADLIPDERTDKMLSHMNVRVQVPVSTDPSLRVIPESALELSDDESVWLVNQDVEVERKKVTVRFVHDGYAYLEGDLEKAWIIVKSPVDLEEGLAVDTAL